MCVYVIMFVIITAVYANKPGQEVHLNTDNALLLFLNGWTGSFIIADEKLCQNKTAFLMRDASLINWLIALPAVHSIMRKINVRNIHTRTRAE